MAMAATTERPTARLRDPSTSHDAGEAVRDSGCREEQRRQVLAAVRAHPGLTSDELAQAAGLDRYMVGRRLPELRDQRELVMVRGYPVQPEKRRSEVSGRKGMVWRPVPTEPEQRALGL